MKYTICIRTLGTAGEKYHRLLDSIEKLTVQPEEILISIPRGYNVPEREISRQRIVFCEKGMLKQRISGYEAAKTEYVLLVDDDIEFEKSLIEKLSKPVLEGRCEITFPIYEKLLPQKGIRNWIARITLAAVPRKSDDYYIKLLPSGGYSYPEKIQKDELYSESAPGMCLFGKREVFLKSDLGEEVWCEKPGYALRDDTVTIYKPLLRGYRTMGIKNIEIEHLDAGSEEKTRNLKVIYASSFNQVIFWHRFIYSQRSGLGKIVYFLGLFHWIILGNSYLFLRGLIKNDLEPCRVSLKGLKDSFYYIRSGMDFGEEKRSIN